MGVREETRDTNNETLVSQVEIGDSDHNEIRFKINAKRKEQQNMALMPDFRKANYQGLRMYLQRVNWEEIGVGRGEDRVNEVERQYNGIVRELQMAQEQYIPKRRIRSSRNYPKWMNEQQQHKEGWIWD